MQEISKSISSGGNTKTNQNAKTTNKSNNKNNEKNNKEGFQNINILGFNFNRTCIILLIIFTLIVMYKEEIMKLKIVKQVFK